MLLLRSSTVKPPLRQLAIIIDNFVSHVLTFADPKNGCAEDWYFD